MTMVKKRVNELIGLSKSPIRDAEFKDWLKQKQVIPFLEKEAQSSNLILYASIPNVLIYGILVPKSMVREVDSNELLSWDHSPYDSWGIKATVRKAWVGSPLEYGLNSLVRNGEQLLFGRSFEGYELEKCYFELSQKLSQPLDLHWVDERRAWCKIDKEGDLFDVVKIHPFESSEKLYSNAIVTIDKNELSKYAVLQEMVFYQVFDFTRIQSEFCGWNELVEEKQHSANINWRFGWDQNNGSFTRGFQIIDFDLTMEEIVNSIVGKDPGKKAFATFLGKNIRNNEVEEMSCNPKCLNNFFEDTGKPFELTPIFFKPDVLLKYKSDTSKYKIDERSLSCRGGWRLSSYDVNSEGYIHTYLVYLGHLPHNEQLHWKQYNVEGEGWLSDRAIETDWNGKYFEGYDSLLSLKRKLAMLGEADCRWWQLRNSKLPVKVNYPVSSSKDEWANEILYLDQFLVEGLEEGWLRSRAKEFDSSVKENFRALRCLEVCLIGMGFEKEQAYKILSPFHDVHNFRSKLKAHPSEEDAEKIRKNAISKFGSYKKHFENLCAECDKSLGLIIEAFESLMNGNFKDD